MTFGEDDTFIAKDEENPGREADSAARPPDAGSKAEEAATPPGMDLAVVIPGSEKTDQLPVPAAARVSSDAAAEQSPVHVPENLHDLIAEIPITPDDAITLRRSRQLNGVIHRILVVGLAISTAAMIAGLALDVVLHREVQSSVPRLEEVVDRITSLRPSGFLALGLLVLIATPILRVLGSFFAFVHERDWRYAGVTFLVMLILSMSLFFTRA